jgi:hypothetical protein
MQKLIKISMYPLSPSIEPIDNMVMKVSGPYSENGVTIQFNPNIVHYQEKQDSDNIKIRQMTVTRPTADTKVLPFDFRKNNIHKVQIENNTFEIKLMTIGKELFEGQNFLYFEFFVTKL